MEDIDEQQQGSYDGNIVLTLKPKGSQRHESPQHGGQLSLVQQNCKVGIQTSLFESAAPATDVAKTTKMTEAAVTMRMRTTFKFQVWGFGANESLILVVKWKEPDKVGQKQAHLSIWQSCV
jgi:hypothetical protein